MGNSGCSWLKSPRVDRPSDAIKLAFVERVATPIPIMKLAIHLRLNGLSLRKTIVFLENFGIERFRSTVHYWVRKSDPEPGSGRSLEKIGFDETIVKIDGEHHWLFAAAHPETTVILYVGVYTARTTNRHETVSPRAKGET